MTEPDCNRPASKLSAPIRQREPAAKLLRSLLFGMLMGAGGAMAAIAVMRSARAASWLQWPSLGPVDWLLLAASAVAAVLLHEVGHLLGGRRGGMQLLMFAVGPLKVAQTAQGLRWSRHSLRHGLLGFVMMMPDPARPIAAQYRQLIAGGPVASLVCLLAAALLALLLDGRGGFHAAAFAAFSAVVFLMTALPMRVGGFETDGFQWRDHGRGGPRAELKSLVLALTSQSISGIRPRDLDAALIARSIALAEQIGTDAIQAPLAAGPHLFAAMHADDRGDCATRDQQMEQVAAHARAMPPAMRAQYAPELAFQAARSRQAAIARDWLALAAGAIGEPQTRLRVDAMLAAAEGRDADALNAVQRARALLSQSMDPGGAKWAADQLDRIEAQLSVEAGPRLASAPPDAA
jgi:hypothetical protein